MIPNVRILIVDDLAVWPQKIRSILEPRPDFAIIGQASDGLEAVPRAEELKPDVILLDIGLPNLNGIESANQLQQLVPRAKVLFLSQNRDAEVVQAALSNGGQAYVLKSDAGRELLPAIEAILRGEKFVSSGIKKWPDSSDSC